MKINHIAFIMDGNRRYAKKNNYSLDKGYKKGMEKFLEIISLQVKYSIKETSFFALSNDNYEKRPSEELETIFSLIKYFSENKQIKDFLITNKIQINIFGDLDEVEKDKKNKLKDKLIVKTLKKTLSELNKKIGEESKYLVNIAFNYDGHKEIEYSMKTIVRAIAKGEIKEKDIDCELIEKNLWYSNSAPEIIVRTGDAPRLSGFLLWYSKYSELFFTKKLWPEFSEADLIEIINWYKNLKRNFGQ